MMPRTWKMRRWLGLSARKFASMCRPRVLADDPPPTDGARPCGIGRRADAIHRRRLDREERHARRRGLGRGNRPLLRHPPAPRRDRAVRGGAAAGRSRPRGCGTWCWPTLGSATSCWCRWATTTAGRCCTMPPRARGTIRGTGDESREIDNPITIHKEVVHTYGWYMARTSPTPRPRG